jgi:phosphatidate cytidylyltransferase
MIKQRVASALVGIPLILAVSWYGGWIYFIVLVSIGHLALRELYNLAGLEEKILRRVGFAGSFLLLLLLFLSGMEAYFYGLILFFLFLNFFWVIAFPMDYLPFATLLWGKLYITSLLSFFLLLRALPGGYTAVLTVFLAIWITDTGAYFTGVSLGRHRMAPVISPKKTWEGALGGLFLTGLALFLFSPFLGLGRLFSVVLGLSLSIAGQIGDLSESALKRWAQVKDSGAFLPGHGGFLDRLDSLLFAAPIAYLLFRFFFNHGGI